MKEKVNNAANQNKIEIQEAREALDRMKYEIATELGIDVPRKGNAYDWRMVPAYYCGLIGGEMVKRSMQYMERMVAHDESKIDDVLKAKESGETIVQQMHPTLTPYEGPSKPIADYTDGQAH